MKPWSGRVLLQTRRQILSHNYIGSTCNSLDKRTLPRPCDAHHGNNHTLCHPEFYVLGALIQMTLLSRTEAIATATASVDKRYSQVSPCSRLCPNHPTHVRYCIRSTQRERREKVLSESLLERWILLARQGSIQIEIRFKSCCKL